MSSIVKNTPTWNVLPTFSRNFPPAKMTTFTIDYQIWYNLYNELLTVYPLSSVSQSPMELHKVTAILERKFFGVSDTITELLFEWIIIYLIRIVSYVFGSVIMLIFFSYPTFLTQHPTCIYFLLSKNWKNWRWKLTVNYEIRVFW